MPAPALDIFLTTHNNLELSIKAIKSLYQYTTMPFRLTVIDNSTDETPAVLKRMSKEHEDFQVIRGPDVMPCTHYALNMALEKTDCDIICVMVNSVRVEPNWLEAAYILINKRKDCGIVGFKILNEWGTIQCTSVMGVYDNGIMAVNAKEEAGHRSTFVSQVPAIGGCLFLIKRAAIKTLDGGRFDQDTYIGFRGWDDIDLCLSIRDKGWDVIYCGYGACYHIDSPTKKKEGNFYDELAVNQQVFLDKWKDFRV